MICICFLQLPISLGSPLAVISETSQIATTQRRTTARLCAQIFPRFHLFPLGMTDGNCADGVGSKVRRMRRGPPATGLLGLFPLLILK